MCINSTKRSRIIRVDTYSTHPFLLITFRVSERITNRVIVVGYDDDNGKSSSSSSSSSSTIIMVSSSSSSAVVKQLKPENLIVPHIRCFYMTMSAS